MDERRTVLAHLDGARRAQRWHRQQAQTTTARTWRTLRERFSAFKSAA